MVACRVLGSTRSHFNPGAVLDFDAVLRDPDKPTQIATPLQSGDHLHGSDRGYEASARSINLSLFR
jgi:hypothetical protein